MSNSNTGRYYLTKPIQDGDLQQVVKGLTFRGSSALKKQLVCDIKVSNKIINIIVTIQVVQRCVNTFSLRSLRVFKNVMQCGKRKHKQNVTTQL